MDIRRNRRAAACIKGSATELNGGREMTVRSGILSIFTAVLAMLTALIAAAGATAFAGTTGDGDRAPGPRPLASVVTYALPRQASSADVTSTAAVASAPCAL